MDATALGMLAALSGGGVGPEDPEVTPIINGEEATEDVYPMTGAMLMDAHVNIQGYAYDMHMFVCSSTLIAPDVVLLAAHCVDEDSFTYGYGTISDMDIRWSRQTDMTRWDGTNQQVSDWPDDAIPAVAWVKHEDFDLMGMQVGIAENSDIALLFLEEPVLDVEPAVVIAADEVDQIVQDVTVDIVGWGQQVATNGYEAPPEGTYAYKMWGESYISELGEAEFQVGAEQTDVRKCHGDSGGPTFLYVETESPDPVRLIGVTSHAYDETDCNRKGGVDTRVDAYLEWIDAQMRAACEDGTRSWCEVEGILPPPSPPEPEVVGDDEPDEGRGGCGCATSTSQAGLAWLLGLVGLVVRRRR